MRCVLILMLSSVLILSCQSQKGDKKSEEKAPPLKLQELVKELPAYPVESFKNNFVITDAIIFDGAGKKYETGFMHVKNGKIVTVGKGTPGAIAGAEKISARGKYITPGIIDTHSHMGVYPNPSARAHSDGNEATKAATPEVWAEHSFWPQDPSIRRALAGGVTAIQVLPGSANLIGGRSFTTKLRIKRSAREMRMAEAPQGIKMACGENPKRVYGSKGGPSTRMGNIAGFRKAYQDAVHYRSKYQKYARDLKHWKSRFKEINEEPATEKKGDGDQATDELTKKLKDLGDPPTFERDIAKETLRKVLNGEILVHIHCYRADDISAMLDLAKEFGFKIRSIHHGLEAYKIAKRLKQEGVSVSTWVDWWGFKMEAFDGIPQNIAILHKTGTRAILHSDSERELRHMNHEMAKALQAAAKIGLEISEAEAVAWITLNPAWALGIDSYTGSLEKGKMADFVIWDKSPFSVYAKAEKVFIDGQLEFDRTSGKQKLGDFELGLISDQLNDGSQFGPIVPPQLPTQKGRPIAAVKKGLSSFVIKGVKLWADGEIIGPIEIEVADGKIKSIGTSVKSSLPVVNGTGRVITSPFNDFNSKMGLVEVELESASVDSRNKQTALQADFRVLDSYNPLSMRVAIERSEGVGQMVLLPGGSFISGLGGAVSLDGDLATKPNGSQSRVLFISMGSRDSYHEGGSRSGLWLRMRQLHQLAVRYIKDRKSFVINEIYPNKFDIATVRVFSQVLNGQLTLAMSIDRAADIKMFVDQYRKWKAVSPKLRVVLIGARESWMVADEIAALGIPVMIQPSTMEPASFDSLRTRDDIVAYLDSKGVNVSVFSTRQRIRQEAGIAASFGLTPQKALKAISRWPKGLGVKHIPIKVGAPAHFVLWNGDPLEPRNYAERMWLNGKEVSLINRQLELANRYK